MASKNSKKKNNYIKIIFFKMFKMNIQKVLRIHLLGTGCFPWFIYVQEY